MQLTATPNGPKVILTKPEQDKLRSVYELQNLIANNTRTSDDISLAIALHKAVGRQCDPLQGTVAPPVEKEVDGVDEAEG